MKIKRPKLKRSAPVSISSKKKKKKKLHSEAGGPTLENYLGSARVQEIDPGEKKNKKKKLITPTLLSGFGRVGGRSEEKK